MTKDVAHELEKALELAEAELTSTQDRVKELETALEDAQAGLASEEERLEESDGSLKGAEEALELDTTALAIWGLEAGARREDVQLTSMVANEALRVANLKQVHRTTGCWHPTTSSNTRRIWCVDCGLTRHFTTSPADKIALADAAGKILADQNNGGVQVHAPPEPKPPRSDPRAVAMEGFCD